MSVHFLPHEGPITSCGLDRRGAGVLTTTQHKAAVTCPACMEAPVFLEAKQRIPYIEGPRRYG